MTGHVHYCPSCGRKILCAVEACVASAPTLCGSCYDPNEATARRPMIRVGLRFRNSKDEIEYLLPITEPQLVEAREGCRAWLEANPHNPLEGAWGVHVEELYIRRHVLWFCKLDDFDRLIALHAIADKHCKISKA